MEAQQAVLVWTKELMALFVALQAHQLRSKELTNSAGGAAQPAAKSHVNLHSVFWGAFANVLWMKVQMRH